MKIEIGYGDELIGIAETSGNTITYSGTNPLFAQNIIEGYQRTNNLQGEELLKFVLLRLTGGGRTWSKKIS
jgi:hypothetical protein